MTAHPLRVPASTAQAEINVTPLIDVMLVLLMIFMLTAQLATHRIPLPLAASGGTVTPQTLALSIQSTGELYLGGAPINRAQLAAVLESVAKGEAPPLLAIRPAADTHYDHVAGVLALAQASGMTAIRVEGTRSD
ncbi:biopolymer transporter ExbD [Dokdonella soli]|uniref:Biopolymer transporter ExbD n=1 Tax=Dokdonella soli TaxID=529810 RepID=A0ABN1IG25_9GAMM